MSGEGHHEYVTRRDFDEHRLAKLEAISNLHRRQDVLEARLAHVPEELRALRESIDRLAASTQQQRQAPQPENSTTLALHNAADALRVLSARPGGPSMLDTIKSVALGAVIMWALSHVPGLPL